MKKALFVKLVIACDDEILNTSKTPFVNEKVVCEKYCLVYSI